MAERVLIDVKLAPIVPSRYGSWDVGSIQSLRPFFEGTQSRLEYLNPVAIIRDPETNRLLVFDGNTRLTLGFLYNLLVPAVIYTVGEILKDRDGTMPIDQTALDCVRQCEARARRQGYTTFSKLASKVK